MREKRGREEREREEMYCNYNQFSYTRPGKGEIGYTNQGEERSAVSKQRKPEASRRGRIGSGCMKGMKKLGLHGSRM